MSATDTEQMLQAYVNALTKEGAYGDYFTDDVTFTVLNSDLQVTGREAVVDVIELMHRRAFDADPEMTNLVAGDRGAAAEFVFRAKHIDEFGGVPATGRKVELPYSAVYDLKDGRISAVRLYMSLTDLLGQLRDEATA